MVYRAGSTLGGSESSQTALIGRLAQTNRCAMFPIGVGLLAGDLEQNPQFLPVPRCIFPPLVQITRSIQDWMVWLVAGDASRINSNNWSRMPTIW